MNDAKLLAVADRNEFRNALSAAKTKQGRFDRRIVLRTREPSDRGDAARRLYDHLAGTPKWLVLYRRTKAGLPPVGKAVIGALEIDWRTAVAARIAGVSRPAVDRWKNKAKKIFAQCYQAWERDFG